MNDSDWEDDSGYHDALRRAGRATRLGWGVVAGTVGALGCALTVLAALCVVAVVSGVYVVMVMHS
ncbi:hypothetical protein [Streptomyces sp. NPDC059166]|uniref:hypothetical protein n=1 Tax=Streptomyces sp. NPDC059166 TaxID=3346752 RepID=UPI0036C4A4E4